ncbi:O-antigen ligase family protein [Patescibacteria group bacterium]|nr:O-antigen ligase family protein [Patescibacteria group bacterium]
MIYILISTIYSIFAWVKPKYALFCLLVFIPSYQIRFELLAIPMTFLEVMILILFIVCLIKKIIQVKKVYFILDKWAYLMLAWLLISLISIFVAPDLRAGAGIWKAYFLEPILLVIIFLALIKNKQDFNFALLSLVFSGFYISIYALFQKITGTGVLSTEAWGASQVLRVTGPFPHPNFLGLWLGPIIALSFGLIVFNFFQLKRLYSLFGVIFLIFSFLALIFARSEGAIIGALAGIIFIGLMHRQSRKIVVSVLLVGVLLFVVVAPINNYIISKVFFNDLSGQLRINIWQGAISLLKTSPVIGVGLSGYQTLIPDFQARYYHPDTNELISVETHPYPHNLFLSLWSEIGLLGWLLFIFIIIMFWHNAWQCIKKQEIYALSVMGAMLVVLVHGLVDTPYFKNDLAVLFWFLIALVIFLKQSLNTEH